VIFKHYIIRVIYRKIKSKRIKNYKTNSFWIVVFNIKLYKNELVMFEQYFQNYKKKSLTLILNN